MKITELDQWLKGVSSQKLASFNRRIIPDSLPILGVKVPEMRKMAKRIAKEDYMDFLMNCPEKVYEHQMMKAMVIGYIKAPVETVLSLADHFIPSIHDWSVCDTFCQTLKICRDNRVQVREWLETYITSEKEYDQRVAAVILLSHFMTKEYIEDMLAQMNRIKHPGYYAQMAVAWCVSMAYVAFPDKTGKFLQDNELSEWTFHKSIQKMIESKQVSEEDKQKWRREMG